MEEAFGVNSGVCLRIVAGMGGGPSGRPAAATLMAATFAIGLRIADPLFSGIPCSIQVLSRSSFAWAILSCMGGITGCSLWAVNA